MSKGIFNVKETAGLCYHSDTSSILYIYNLVMFKFWQLCVHSLVYLKNGSAALPTLTPWVWRAQVAGDGGLFQLSCLCYGICKGNLSLDRERGNTVFEPKLTWITQPPPLASKYHKNMISIGWSSSLPLSPQLVQNKHVKGGDKERKVLLSFFELTIITQISLWKMYAGNAVIFYRATSFYCFGMHICPEGS